VLKILGEDLSKINKAAIIGALKYLQTFNGCFQSCASGGETDMRFVFCACAISHLLNDWSGIDIDRTVKYIASCQSYDGGIGLYPESEGHGGSTFCAIASLSLLRRLNSLRDRDALLKWSVANQGDGYRGRPNKPPDTCYSFWTGATLSMLGGVGMASHDGNRRFNLSCQGPVGGFSKVAGAPADALHAYYGLCGLSLMGKDGLLPLDVSVGLTARASGRKITPDT